MIFVTVGTQLPFDRMVGAVDRWAGESGSRDVFAQVGPTPCPPRNIAWAPFLDAGEFHRRCEHATLIVAHLGMGSIITALELGKPILVMPRLASLNEHRNDHQVAMAKRLEGSSRICIARDENELLARLIDESLLRRTTHLENSRSSQTLLTAIRAFVCGDVEDQSTAEAVDAAAANTALR